MRPSGANGELRPSIGVTYWAKKRISQDSGGIDHAEKKLGEAENSIRNIISAIEQGAVSEILIQKLKQLESEKAGLTGKIKFLSGADHSEVYITPAVIKKRFQEIPELLRTSKPFELNKALRGIVGKTGIKLSYHAIENKKGEYWARGSLNIGRALLMVEDLGYGDSASIRHEVAFEICLE